MPHHRRLATASRSDSTDPRPVECHFVSLAELASFTVADFARPHGDHLGGETRYADPARQVVALIGRLLLSAVCARHLRPGGAASASLVVAPGGRPVPLGEGADGAHVGLAHDRAVLVVGYHPRGCSVDVEDSDPASLAEVADRFCAPHERPPSTAATTFRALWSAKEAVLKFAGVGLRGGMRTVSFSGDPGEGWVRARRPDGTSRPDGTTGPLCRVVEVPGRHLAIAVGADRAPRVETRFWSPHRSHAGPNGVCLVESPPPRHGPLAALALGVRATNTTSQERA